MAQIVCKDVVLGYEGKAVVQNLNFEVNKGDYLCIVGENGSGKSTLIRAMLRLKEPMSGEICMDDGLETDGIGYLPQQTVVQKDFPASVQEIVRSGCLGRFGWRPFYGRAEKERAAENMEKLGIAHLQNAATGSCPGASSREFCWQERSVQPDTCCFWMSRCPGLTRQPFRKCMSFWKN